MSDKEDDKKEMGGRYAAAQYAPLLSGLTPREDHHPSEAEEAKDDEDAVGEVYQLGAHTPYGEGKGPHSSNCRPRQEKWANSTNATQAFKCRTPSLSPKPPSVTSSSYHRKKEGDNGSHYGHPPPKVFPQEPGMSDRHHDRDDRGNDPSPTGMPCGSSQYGHPPPIETGDGEC